MAREYKIPFRKWPGGEIHMLEYPGWDPENQTEWRDNLTFKADLQMQGSYRGRSAVRVRVKNLSNGEIYSMGFSTFVDAAETLKISKGKITGGTWTFEKRGSNYGLVLLQEKSSK